MGDCRMNVIKYDNSQDEIASIRPKKTLTNYRRSSKSRQRIKMDVSDNFQLLKETFNSAVLDYGTSLTVCGAVWLESYALSLTPSMKKQLKENPSRTRVQFMDGKVVESVRKVELPAQLGEQLVLIESEVVELGIPLLLSGHSLKAADVKLDLVNNSVTMLHQTLRVRYTKTGHLYVPLISSISDDDSVVKKVYDRFTGDKRKLSHQLHVKFNHAPGRKIAVWMQEAAGVNDPGLCQFLVEAERVCTYCSGVNMLPLDPFIRCTLSDEFNKTISIGVELCRDTPILFMIDKVIRFSMAAVVRDTADVVRLFNENWVQVFHCPSKIIVNGVGNGSCLEILRRFENAKIGITDIDTDFELFKEILLKLKDDGLKYPLEVLVLWASNIKNSFPSLHNISANELVLGRDHNFTLLSYLKEGYCLKTVVAKYIKLLFSARESFSGQTLFGMRKD